MNVRSFGIIPAAGFSRRMGQPKLLLPWGDELMIHRVLRAWLASGVEEVVVVVRADDNELLRHCRDIGVEVVAAPTPPVDMKASVILGLERVRQWKRPAPTDAWLMAPADMPELAARHIDALIARHDPASPRILVPVCAGRRGHPVLFPWACADQVARLGPDQGLNALVNEGNAVEFEVDDSGILLDIDTPEDYE